MIKKGEIDKKSGFEYTLNGERMYEYHVDDHIKFQEKCNHLPFGGNLSVHKSPDEKSVMMNGQDEAIFKQLQLSGSSWTLADGSRQLCPKDEGQGLMLSAFCS